MPNDSPFISIIVPTYNRANLITKTLESLLAQTYPHYEILVVDDGSTDNTEDTIRQIKNPKIQYFKKQNAERAAARNYGAQRAKGEYVNFFDSDDIALPHHLEEAITMIKKYQHPEWFHLGYAWASTDGPIFKKIDYFKGNTLQPYIPHGNPLSCNGVFIRKDIIIDNPFNEDRLLSGSEDYELWYRLAARYPLHYSNIITNLIIDHEARSVRTIHSEHLITRINLLLKYLRNDHKVMEVFCKEFSSTEIDSYTYLALHLSETTSSKPKALAYIGKALSYDKKVIFQRRLLATIRNLILRW